MSKMTMIMVRMGQEAIQRLDARRGNIARSVWVRQAAEAILSDEEYTMPVPTQKLIVPRGRKGGRPKKRVAKPKVAKPAYEVGGALEKAIGSIDESVERKVAARAQKKAKAFELPKPPGPQIGDRRQIMRKNWLGQLRSVTQRLASIKPDGTQEWVDER